MSGPELMSHTFEAGRRGKPDELESQIAQLISAYVLQTGDQPRFDLRVTGDWHDGKPFVHVGGEISKHVLERADVGRDVSDIVLAHYNQVHREDRDPDDISVAVELKPQADPLATNGAAGDSGNPIGVAVAKAPNYLPWERHLAVGLRDMIDGIYQDDGRVPDDLASISGISRLPGLRADGKINVNASYLEGFADSIDKITLAIEHEHSLPVEVLRERMETLTYAFLAREGEAYQEFIELGKPKLIINGRGDWNQGGWQVDAGTREAKPYRDGFSSHGCNEDSIAGEDGTKVSGTGTFLARYAAVQLVANDLAEYARVTLDYSIGSDEVDVNVFTHGTGRLPQKELQDWIKGNVPLQIGKGIDLFDLWNPDIYRATAAASDLFQNPEFPWNTAKAYADLRNPSAAE